MAATVETVNVREKYGALSIASPPSVALAEVNLGVRGFIATTSTLGLVDSAGLFDEGAPQLNKILFDERIPTLVGAYQVYEWDSTCNCRGAVQTEPSVTLIGIATTPGEILRAPRSSYYIAEDY